jgi:hypothetical protein
MNKITSVFICLFISFSQFIFAQNGPGGVGDDASNRFWFIAEQLNQSDGSAVPLWSNLGGNANDATSFNNDPTYVTNSLNGYAAIQFGIGANAGLTIPDNTDLNNGGPWSERSFSIVVETGADVATRQMIYEEGGSGRGFNMYIFNGNLYYGAWNTNNDGTASPWGFTSSQTPINANTSYVISFIYNGNDTSTGSVECYLNGTLVGTIPNIGFLYAHDQAGIGNLEQSSRVETGVVNSNLPFDGFVSEFVMYNFNLNTSQRISLENYLSSKYDIGIFPDDIYDQDTALNGEYDFNLVSVNRQSSIDEHVITNQGTGLISLNTSSPLTDGDYFSLGSDLKDQTFLGPIVCNPSNLDISRLQTTWRVDKVGSVTPNINFDLSPANINVTDVSEITILIDDNPSFSSPIFLNASTLSPTTATFSGLTINDGDYVTFEVSVNRSILNTRAGLNLPQELRFAFEANTIDQADGTDVATWINEGENLNDASTQTNSPSLLMDVSNGQDFVQFSSANNESLEIPDNSDINQGGEPYIERTYSLVFQTGTNVNPRQVIYEEGGTTRGVVIYILNGELYFGAYNESNDGAGSPWTFRSVITNVNPNTTYVMTNVFNGNDSSTGVIQTYLNGSLVGTTTGVGYLYDHGANISIGQNGDGNIYEGGGVTTASYFNGLLGEFLIYDNALDTNQIDILNNFLLAKYGVTPTGNDIYTYDTNGGGDFDFNLLGVRQTSASRLDETTYSTGIIKFKNPSSMKLGDALIAASDTEEQTTLNTSTVDCSNTLANDLRLTATWRINVSGTPGTIDIELDFDKIDIEVNSALELDLLIDDNPNFTSPTRISASEFCSTALYQNVNFTNGEYFTFERTGIQPVLWDGSNYSNGSGPLNEPTVTDQYKKLVIDGAGAILSEDAACTCLSVTAPSNLNTSGFNLNITGDVNNAGILSGDGEVVLTGASAQTISGGGSFENLRLDNSTRVDFTDSADLFGVVYVDQGTLNTNGNLSLRCNFGTSGKTAQVGPVGGTIVGDVTVEQCYPARRAFRFLSSSVTTATSIRENWQENPAGYEDNPRPGYGTHITGVSPGSANASEGQDGNNGFDYSPSGNASMFTFDNATPSWDRVTNTNGVLTAGEAYRLFLRGDRSINISLNGAPPTATRLSATGVLAIGGQPVTNLSGDAGAFNFIGNPYQAQVNMIDLIAGSTNISPTQYYVWDPTLGGSPTPGSQGGRGAYVTVQLPAGTNSFTPSGSNKGSNANQYLQPMQAAFVTTTGAAASMTFEESYKAVGEIQTDVKSNSVQEYINIQLFDANSFAEGATPSDGLRINFDKSFSISTEDDSPKLGNLDENLARVEGNVFSAIERRPLPEATEELPLFINQYRRESYVMKFDVTDNLNTEVFIKDKYLDQVTEITSSQNTYSFVIESSIPESEASDRFSLVFEPVSLSIGDENLVNLSLYPNPTKGNFSISGIDSGQDTEVKIYNIIGQQVYTAKSSGQSTLEITDFNASTGVYLVKLKTNQGEKTFKLIKD